MILTPNTGANDFVNPGVSGEIVPIRDSQALADAIASQGAESLIVELDLAVKESITTAFRTIREEAGNPEVLIYNAGYLEGRVDPIGIDGFGIVADAE